MAQSWGNIEYQIDESKRQITQMRTILEILDRIQAIALISSAYELG